MDAWEAYKTCTCNSYTRHLRKCSGFREVEKKVEKKEEGINLRLLSSFETLILLSLGVFALTGVLMGQILF